MFADRVDAGRMLAGRVAHLPPDSTVVLGMPRGGVVVAAQIASALGCALDVLIVRKLGAPGRPELAIGAVTDGTEPAWMLNEDVIAAQHVDADYVAREVQSQLEEVRRQEALFRRGRPPVETRGRTVVVGDDGIATGASVRAGIAALRRRAPRRIILAVPVAPLEVARELAREVDELVCLHAPREFRAVGAFYVDFRQVEDDEVIALLERASSERPSEGHWPSESP